MTPPGSRRRRAAWRTPWGALVAVCALALWADGSSAQAPGGLMVTPTRVVLEGRGRTAEVTLINHSSETTTYRIGFRNLRMRDDGSYERIEQPGPEDRVADGMLRYSPRQVTLRPGVPQKIRLLARKPRDLPAGEYRSHLLFQAIPPETAGMDVETLQLPEGEIRVQMRTVFGISIPVIVRQGELTADVALSGLSVRQADGGPRLHVQLERSGERSVYGDVTVTFTAESGGKHVVGLVRGLAVLTPNDRRTMDLPLQLPEGVALTQGRLAVSYRQSPEEGGKLLASAELPLS